MSSNGNGVDTEEVVLLLNADHVHAHMHVGHCFNISLTYPLHSHSIPKHVHPLNSRFSRLLGEFVAIFFPFSSSDVIFCDVIFSDVIRC